MARLILATHDGQQAIELRPVNSLGRHPNNSIQLLDKIVSKEHCIVEQRGGQFILRDLGSLNGTYINGERVAGEQLLRHGDEIALGSTIAKFDDGSGGVQFSPHVSGPGAIAQPAPSGPQVGGPPRPPMQSWPGGMPPAPPSQPHVDPGPAPSAPTGAHQYPGAYAQGQPQQSPPQSARRPAAPAPPAPNSMGGHHHSTAAYPPAPRPPPRALNRTRVDLLDSARAIGAQINAETKDFLPFDQLATDPSQLRVDYERLRLTWELTRDIGLERDLDRLLEKILFSLFKFVNADRGVILLREGDGSLQPRAARRRDGTDAPIQISSTILNKVVSEQKSVLSHDAPMDFAAAKGKSMILNRISSAIVVPLLHERDVLGAIWLDSESLGQFKPKDLDILTAVANQAAMFIENNLLTKKIEQEIVTRERFSRLLSPNVAEQVISGKLEIKKGGQRVPECTVFNSDIRGFTRMSEDTPAEQMVDMLNEYFEEMVAIIFRYEGTLDKFMGDGIMALWGAPACHPDDAIRCVCAALDQMETLGRFNRERLSGNLSPLAIGIGVHTGPLVAGYVGSSKALSYTVIGDTANTSARLCGIAQAGQILVSEGTLGKLGDRFEYDELEPAQLKGKERPLRIFNIKRERPSAAQSRPQAASGGQP